MEVINLNLIPNGITPVVHVSQYDEGRDFRFNLFEGSAVVTLDGTEVIECDIKKPDGNIVTVAVTNTSSTYIDISTTLQMTACYGDAMGTINISKGGDNLYTKNFVLACEKSPLDGGVQSDTDIHNLQTQVEGMVDNYLGNDYYNKTQTDALLLLKANYPTDTLTNQPIATFPDGSDNVPLSALEVEIEPNLSGVSSVNVYRMGKNLFNKNGNLTASYFIGSNGTLTYSAGWNTTDYEPIKQGDYTMSGETATGAYYAICWYDEDKTYISGYQKFTQNATSVTIPSNAKYVRYSVHDTALDTFQLELGSIATTYDAYNGTTYPISLGGTYYGGTLDVKNGVLTVKYARVDLGSLTWVYYTSGVHPIFYASASASKVYAVGDTPNAIVDIYTFKNVDNRTNLASILNDKECSFITNGTNFAVRNDDYTDTTAFATAMSGKYLTYELATPTVITGLSDTDIRTLLGNNNIFADSGDIEKVTYRADIGLYIDKLINA